MTIDNFLLLCNNKLPIYLLLQKSPLYKDEVHLSQTKLKKAYHIDRLT